MDLVEVRPEANYCLFVRYDDGVNGVIDLSAYAGVGVFEAWQKPGVFEQVKLTQAGHPEWPGGLDLCPHALYLRLTGKPADAVFPSLQQPSTHA